MNTSKKDPFAWVEWIIVEREKREWTQADLARKTGLTRTAISQYEKRQRATPDVEALSRISEAFGFPAEYLPRLANQFPAPVESDEETEQIVYEAKDLNNQDKQEVVAFIRMLKNLRKRK